MRNTRGQYLKIKRGVDVIASLAGLLFLIPVLVLTAIFIKFTSSGPILFKQERIGLNGKTFRILKFRTMVVNAEKIGKQITVNGDPRITKVGKFLRKFKLDELPQLYNVLKGEMSLAGPRPEVKKYIEMYSEEQRRVLTVRPGITDYASIEYRNENDILALSNNPEHTYITKVMPEKLVLNLRYIEEISLLTDLKLIFLTLLKIVMDTGTDDVRKDQSSSLGV